MLDREYFFQKYFLDHATLSLLSLILVPSVLIFFLFVLKKIPFIFQKELVKPSCSKVTGFVLLYHPQFLLLWSWG